jgi:Fe-S cluster assembly iron-binding protein IscA
MFTLTQAAGARLAHKLVKKDAGDDVALRFVRDGKRRGWAVRVDRAGPADDTFCHEGRVVLVVDQQSAHLLRNKTLDVVETGVGMRLRLS